MVIKLDVRKILHGGPRMLTRDLFAIANFPVTSAKEGMFSPVPVYLSVCLSSGLLKNH